MNDIIRRELEDFPSRFPSFREKEPNYIFNGLAVKNIFYKNPSFVLDDSTLTDIVVDGTGDNGIDCILTDLSSDHNDMIFVQCKYHETIALDGIKSAISKMVNAYILLKEQRFDQFNDRVVKQYLRCQDEMEEGAKIKFVFVTSSPRNNTKTVSVLSHFKNCRRDLKIEMDESCVFFENEFLEAIAEAKSLMPCIDEDKLTIDSPDNVLFYNGDLGAVFNISALSLKTLYGKYHNALLSQNLRYFVKNKTIDRDVDDSIKNKPDEFWFKNNGITIICDNYELSSKVLKLYNFSVINGGQTTRKIYDSADIFEGKDLYLICRVIKNPHDDKEEKQQFIYEVSKATNSQKAIKPSDLRANNKEQKLFEDALLRSGVFYKTKRGMEVPASYRSAYLNCDLPKVGKLALAGLFLMPGSSRNKPSIIYEEENNFYDTIFAFATMNRIAPYIADLLYVDYYFDKKFITNYRVTIVNDGKKRFAGNCRTFVTAFVGFFGKYYQNEFDTEDMVYISNAHVEKQDDVVKLQKILYKNNNCPKVFTNRSINLDERDSILDQMFKYAINLGFDQYNAYKNAQGEDDAVDETNWLKRDSSFYLCLKSLVDKLIEDPNEPQLQSFKKLFQDN